MFPVLYFLALLSGAQEVAASTEPPDAPAPAVTPLSQHEFGRKIYNFRCYYCHGYSGNAKTLAATYLTPSPRNFTSVTDVELPRQKMLDAVQNGRPGTAMKSFRNALRTDEMEAVVDFIRTEFMQKKHENTHYHTPENGWPDHESRYAAAIPFATWEIPLDTPWEKLTPAQQGGKRLFLGACISCHDRARVSEEGAAWEGRPLSYPRNNYTPGQNEVDAVSSASPYARHDIAPRIADLTAQEKHGETLFQANCSFCHAADGTGRNWIGSFLQPHPRDLVNSPVMDTMTRDRLRETIRNGLPGTSMPAWKHTFSDADIDAIAAYVSRAFHKLQD